MVEIDHNFFVQCRGAVDFMRQAGMNEVRMAWVLYDVRAAAISEERARVERILANNLPSFGHTDDIKRGVDEWCAPRDDPRQVFG